MTPISIVSPAPVAPAETITTAPATTAAPVEKAATAASTAAAAADVLPASSEIFPAQKSASDTLGKILGVTATILVGIVPTIPAGAIAAAATLAEGALRAISEWLTSKGSGNSMTEAQAEAALQTLLKSLNTLAAPLPTPEALE